MQYRRLGRTGLNVSSICLGTAFRGRQDDALCTRIIDMAIDRGCNFIDTANIYGRGCSESLLGKAIQGKRDDLVIASKVCSPMGERPNDRGLSRYHIMQQIEGSLRRLKTDHVDLYYLHTVDPDCEWEETLRTMEDLVRQGKVRYLGASNYDAPQVAELLWTADRRDWTPIVCLQEQYSLLCRRKVEADLLPLCRRHGLGLMGYSPLAVGLLTGRFRRDQPAPPRTPWTHERLNEELSPRGDALIGTLVRIARGLGRSPAQVALAWLLGRSELTAPIIGPDLPEHLDEAFVALDLDLPPEDRLHLDEASQWEAPRQYL